jgi:hypothetical protein
MANESRCRVCERPLMEMDSVHVCTSDRCDRWGMPVDSQGRTVEEALADAIAPLVPDDDATGVPQ